MEWIDYHLYQTMYIWDSPDRRFRILYRKPEEGETEELAPYRLVEYTGNNCRVTTWNFTTLEKAQAFAEALSKGVTRADQAHPPGHPNT